jgi:hypothetical protein
MILLIASAIEISVKTVPKNKLIRLNRNRYEKMNHILNYYFLLHLFFSLLFLFQISIDENGRGIPYVNISIKGKPIGTVSNMKATFY